MPEFTLDDVLAVAARRNRPVFLYFTSELPGFRGVQRRLDYLLSRPRVAQVIGASFAWRFYERAGGVGMAAAQRLGALSAAPTLVVLTPQGDPFFRWVLPDVAALAGVTPESLASLIEAWAREAGQDTQQVVEDARSQPGNIILAQRAAQRAWALGDTGMTREFLNAVVAADETPARATAARAAWQSVLIDLAEQRRERGLALARQFVERFPAQALPAARLLAASGAPPVEVDQAVTGVVAHGRPRGSVEDPARPTVNFNDLAFDALELAAFEGALAAAEANVSARPQDPNAYDTLAQVQAARGESEAAVASAQRGLELADECSPIAQHLRETLCGARTSRLPVALAGERRLAQDLVTVLGEDELFVADDPCDVVRRALAQPVRELAREYLAGHVANGVADQLVVLVSMGEQGRVARLDLFAPGVDEQALQSLRDHASELRAPVDAPGLQVLLRESMTPVES